MKEKEVSGMNATNELATDIDDASWKEAFKNRDYKNLAKAYVYRGNFTLPEKFPSSNITLFYKNIGLEQTIYVNGKAVASNLKQNETGNGFVLDKNILKAGKNVIAILATPIPKKHDWESVNTDPGLIQIVTAAQPWKRKLFNGLAQVIVQTTKEAGEIVLTATSSGLQPTSIKLQSGKVTARASVD
jgi:beta-galactosidase